MSTNRRMWIVVVVIGLAMFAMGCELSGAVSTVTPTAKATAPSLGTLQTNDKGVTPSPTTGVQAGGGSGGTGGSSGGSDGGSGSSGGGSGNSGGNGSSSAESGTPTQPDLPLPGPYIVKQIESLGGEIISGAVCNVGQPFTVSVAAREATFAFQFAPLDAEHGKITYQYSIPKAGESHDAGGTYKISQVDSTGTLQVSLSVSDHVVFKGFDGNIPNRYKFNLVPSDSTGCKPGQ